MRIVKKIINVLLQFISDVLDYDLPLLSETGIHKPYSGLRLGDKECSNHQN